MLRVYSFETMNIEKTFKLTIKDTSFYLDATEINALYNECGKALNIGNTNPSYPPGVTKLDPVKPSDYPSWPQPSDYPNWPAYGTTTDYPSQYSHSDMTTDNFEFDLNTSLNVPSSKGINFIKDDLSDDMTTIKENNNWRSSVQKALDKLSAKTDVNFSTNKSGGTNIR